MDRQPPSNLHLSQVKVPTANDSLPSTSRQVAKNCTRPCKQQGNKNGFGRFQQNKQSRSREPKSLTQHLRDSVESSRNYLDDSKHHALVASRKKVANNGKVSLKERFVQANCQFVMSSTSDNCAHLKDPDLTINWDWVEEVLFTCTNNELCCPICLCHPTAAKISRCGHIYCWSCILHYLALSDKESRSCPICFETIKKTELKSVCIINKVDYAPNDYLTFTLMKIRKNSTIALPANFGGLDGPKDPMHRLKRNVSQTLNSFGKIFTASPSYVSDIIEREMGELKQQLLEYQLENMPEVCFVHSAFGELEKRKQQVALGEQFAHLLPPKEPPVNVEDYIYFYQSDDGQSIYLHPLNVRMLKREYGELKNCPLFSITARIIELDASTINEDIRRRNAHLRHLPLSCEFKTAEVEFDTAIVSQATLDDFAVEINNRKKSRKRKEKAQNIRDRKIEIENNKKIYGISPAPTFQLDNAVDFPEYLQHDEQPALEGDPALIDQTELGSSPSSAEFQSSFARMLSLGGSDFDKTLRKPKPPSPEHLEYLEKPSDDGDEGAVAVQQMNITLGDFFDNCVKTSKRGKRNRKK